MQQRRDESLACPLARDSNTDLFGPQRESDFLLLVIELENPVLNLIAPQKFVALEIFDAVVGRYELANTSLANVAQILLGIVPRFRYAHLEKAWLWTSNKQARDKVI